MHTLKEQHKLSRRRAFSLIELMVAVSIFSVVMLIAVGSLLSMIDANRKAQAIKSVINNLNFAIESMVRNARVGTNFHCENDSFVNNAESPLDCAAGGILFAFEGQFGSPLDPNDQIVYRINGTQLERSTDSGTNFIAVTAPEVVIDKLTFYVTGAPRLDSLQPHMVVIIQGHAGRDKRSRTEFNLQGGATQRLLDI